MGLKTRFRQAWDFLTWVGSVFILVAIPLLFLVFGAEREFAQEMARQREERVVSLEAKMGIYRDAEVVERKLLGFLSFPQRRWQEEIRRDRVLPADLRELKAAHPGSFEFVVFDENDRMIASCSDLPEFHPQMDGFATDIRRYLGGDQASLREHMARYRPLLGPLVMPLAWGPITRDLYTFRGFSSFSRRRALLGMSVVPSPNPWILALVSFPPDRTEFYFRLLAKIPCEIDGRNELIDLGQPPESWGRGLGEASDVFPRALLALGDSQGRAIFCEGHVWSQILISPRKRWVVAVPDDGFREFEAARGKLWRGAGLFLSLLLLSLFTLSWAWERLGLGPPSLRVKILGLFVFTAGIPLVLLAYSARGLFIERRRVLERKVFQDQENALIELNRRTIDFFGGVEQRCRAWEKVPLPDRKDAGEAVSKRMAELVKTVRPELYFATDLSGSLAGSGFTSVLARLEKALPIQAFLAAREMSKKLHLEFPLAAAAKEQAIRAMGESAGVDMDGLSTSLGEAISGLTRTEIGTTVVNFLLLILRGPSGDVRYFCCLGWAREAFYRFLKHRIHRFQREVPGIELNIRTTRWSNLQGLGTPFPLPLHHLEKLVSLLEGQAAPVTTKIFHEGRTFLVTALILPDYQDFGFAWSTDEGIQGEVQKTAVRLAIAGALLLALGFGLGLLISRSLLRPLGFLAKGMEAMKEHDFAARIPVLSHDELGNVSRAFNQMMEGMADLEVARIVQDTFFPQAPLRGHGWEVCGISRPASRVGGDYFDYFPRPDGRWLILIGDVTGHGVPAALVVGMAKALVCHPSSPGTPAKMLELMSSRLQEILKSNRLMSCFLALFDPQTEELTAANAGHCFPFLVKAHGVEELRILSSPLGGKTRKPFLDTTLRLAGIAAVCLYTDGLIETLDAHEQPIGYEVFGKNLPASIGPTARETEAAILAWHRNVAVPGPQADDLTLVILQRSTESGAPTGPIRSR